MLLTCQSSGYPTDITYQFYVNNIQTAASGNTISATNSGNYSCKAKNIYFERTTTVDVILVTYRKNGKEHIVYIYTYNVTCVPDGKVSRDTIFY